MSDQLLKRIAHLSPEQREQLLRRLNTSLNQQPEQQRSVIPLRKADEPCYLSFAQQRLWFLDQLDGPSAQYTVCRAIHLSGPLRVEALEESLQTLLTRHESLRTCFVVPPGQQEPLQVIVEPAPRLPLPLVDLSGLPAARRAEQAQQLARAWVQLPFSLRQAPLLRWLLLRLTSQEHVLLWCLHHSIADGWSLALLLRDLSALYTHRLTHPGAASSPLPPLPLQFADYALWQRRLLQGERLQDLLAYWSRQLAGAPDELPLPFDRPRPQHPEHRGALLTRRLPASLRGQLNALARQQEVTLFMLLLSVFGILLARLSGQEDLLIGTPVANRGQAQLESVVGCLANTLVLRMRLEGMQRLEEVLGQVRETTLQAAAHQELPFEKLVEALQPQRDLRRSPLFQVMFVLQNTPASPLSLPDIEARIDIVDVEAAPFDITCSVEEREDGLEVGIQYDRDLFEASTIQRMLRAYELLLTSCSKDPERSIWSLPLVTPEEERYFSGLWNRSLPTRSLYLHELFAEQARQRPDALAVISGSTALTYQELEGRANSLASQLVALGVRAETLVGLCVERSAEMLIGLLAILKAGGAYVPLDPTYPPERLRLMLEDAQPAVVLTLERLQSRLPVSALSATHCVYLDAYKGNLAPVLDAPPRVLLNLQNLAYVIYTSGSSGTPKGVGITHEASAQFCQRIAEHYALLPADRVLQFASLSFDLALEEIFAPLSRGATLVLWPQQTGTDLVELTRCIDQERISVVNFSSSLWDAWLDALIEQEIQPPASLRLVITGNEPLTMERLRLWRQHVGTRIRWLHAYGVTETTVTSLLCSPEPSELEGTVPIGIPIYNTRIFILDSHWQPVPPGVPGKLYIGGPGLARGYLHHPEMTAERFVPDPFTSTPGSLLFDSGDLAYYREDGLVRYLGREDQQVKLRGLRIEVAEIEQTLKRHPSLQEVAVVVREDLAGKSTLVAYFTSRNGQTLSARELRDFLGEHLPAFMLPSTFVQLESLPLLPNGKLDRQRLPAPGQSLDEEESAPLVPSTPLEDLLLTIWKDLLRQERVSITANFFELGGHSLLAAQVTARLGRILKRDVPVRLLFEYPTISRLAARLEQLLQEDFSEMPPPIQNVERNLPLPLSFEQLRLWFLDQLEPDSALYNLPVCIRLIGPLRVEALEESLQALLTRHESLRTCFVTPPGQQEPLQMIVEPAPRLPLPLVDLSGLPAARRAEQAQQLARAWVQLPFSLHQAPLLRWLLLRLTSQEHVLLWCLHHSVADGWSLALLLRDLSAFYTHRLTHPGAASSPLPPLPLQFADYALWQRRLLQGERLQDLLAYWSRQLAGAPDELPLPFDHPRPQHPEHRGALLTRRLPASLHGQLNALARRQEVTLFMLLLSVFGILLARLSGQEDLLIGTPVANRGQAQLESVVGCLANTLVLRMRLEGVQRLEEVLGQVRETTLQAVAHQELPFEKLVEALQPQRDLRRSPLFQVMFVLQNTPAQTLEMPSLQSEFLKVAPDLAKFDLAFSVTETEDGLDLTAEYSTELFESATVQRFQESYQNLLEGTIAGGTEDWRQLPLLSAQERNKLLVEWARPEHPVSYDVSDLPLHRLFEDQVERTPEARALVYRDQHLSFAELNRRANQLASYLRGYMLGGETPVGLCVERSPEMIIGLLAILKAGGYYVPLDAAYPAERLKFLMEDANIAVLLTQRHLLSTMPVLAAARVPAICFDEEALALEATENPVHDVSADNLAYSIYTSGSTGRPKGVLVPHRGVINVIRHALHTYIQEPGQQLMQHTSLSFDASVLEIFASLLSGGCLHLVPPELTGSGEGLARFITEQEIAVLIITPSLLEMVPYARYPALHTIILGGESCPLELANLWLQGYRLFNVYAPTETTIYMTQAELRGSYRSLLPLGRPIGHMSTYVLDPYMQPAPIGVCGELYIGGVGVTRGYHHLPALTAERFVPDPFASEPGRRLYKTGDLACYLPTGELRFLGRNDNQVKIRGLRVELGEIEAILAQHPRVQHAVVLLEGENSREKQLIACFVPTEGPDPAPELRQFLFHCLPSSLLPGRFVSFASFPLNVNGKIDRQGVQRMLYERRDIFEAEAPYQAPRNPVEELLATIWQEALGGGPIGIDDNFFQRGGHSLLATQIVSQIRETFQIELPLRTLFEAPTIAGLAERIIEQGLAQADADTLAALLPQLQD